MRGKRRFVSNLEGTTMREIAVMSAVFPVWLFSVSTACVCFFHYNLKKTIDLEDGRPVCWVCRKILDRFDGNVDLTRV